MLPGLSTTTLEDCKQAILSGRTLALGQELTLPTALEEGLTIIGVAGNCYTVAENSRPWDLFKGFAIFPALIHCL